MLNRFDTVFVKNDYGSYGWGVYKIEKDQDCYSCISGGEDTKTIFFVDLWEMYEFLESRLGKRGVIQQGINSARVMGKIFDLRVNAQKNIHGEWTLSIVSVRVAPEKAAVTNTSQVAQEIVLGLYEHVPFGLFEWDNRL